MKLFKSLVGRVLAVAVALSVVPAALPEGTPVVGISKAEAQQRFIGHGGYHGRRPFYRGGGRYYGGHRGYYGRGDYYGGRRYYRGRPYYRHHNDGAAVAAGIIGLGVGAAIASSARPRYYEPAPRYYGSSHARYCAARYRSYDPYTNTFQPYNGPRRICR